MTSLRKAIRSHNKTHLSDMLETSYTINSEWLPLYTEVQSSAIF